MKYVIVGNGVAGVCAAEIIREMDSEGSITLIGDESPEPYCRPMISHLLEGSLSRCQLTIRRADFYEKLSVTPVTGKRITGMDTKRRCVFVEEKREARQQTAPSLMSLIAKLMSIVTGYPDMSGSGERFRSEFPFDKLLIATGADPRPVKAAGPDLRNIFHMRTRDQVGEMLETLPDATHALVLGGGLVGLKAAHALLRRGLRVTMVIRSGHPLSMQVDEEAGKIVLETLCRHGLEVRVGSEVIAFQGEGRVEKARMSDGSDIPCDMAIIGKGVLPALSFVPRKEIRTDLGILVDEHMETNVPGIFAAGDVAETVDIARKTPWVNAIWPEAVSQGRIAGANMAGREVAYKGSLSRNVIRIFDLDVMTGGVVNPPADDPGYESIRFRDPRRNIYRKLVFREDRLVGMVMVNAVEQGGILLSLIQSETPIRIPRHRMAAPDFNYGQLI